MRQGMFDFSYCARNAPVKVNPDPPTPGYRWGLVLNSVQKLTNAPPCGETFCGK